MNIEQRDLHRNGSMTIIIEEQIFGLHLSAYITGECVELSEIGRCDSRLEALSELQKLKAFIAALEAQITAEDDDEPDVDDVWADDDDSEEESVEDHDWPFAPISDLKHFAAQSHAEYSLHACAWAVDLPVPFTLTDAARAALAESAVLA